MYFYFIVSLYLEVVLGKDLSNIEINKIESINII